MWKNESGNNNFEQLRIQPKKEQRCKEDMTPEQKLVKLLHLIRKYEANNSEEKLLKIAKSMYDDSSNNPSFSQVMKKAYHTESLRILNKLAKNKYSDAQYYLGIIYKEKESYKKAAHLFEQAYQNKHPMGTFQFGQCYEYGLGKSKDIRTAESLYRKAAMVGYCQPAMIHLGMAYLNGNFGGKVDINEAVNWLEKATASLSNNVDKQLLAKACYELFKIYALGNEEGNIIPCNETALIYLNMSADNGYIEAMLELSKIEKDNYQKMFYWMSKAAENNSLEAQINIATWYLCEDNKIVKPDKSLGFYWLKKAALPKNLDNDNDKRNQGRIQFILGTYYETGIDDIQQPDENEAMYWFGLAAKLGITEAIEKMEEKREKYNMNDTSLSDFVEQVINHGFFNTPPESLIQSIKEKEKLTVQKRPLSSMTSINSLLHSPKDTNSFNIGTVSEDNQYDNKINQNVSSSNNQSENNKLTITVNSNQSDTNKQSVSNNNKQNNKNNQFEQASTKNTTTNSSSKKKSNHKSNNSLSHKLMKILPKKLCM